MPLAFADSNVIYNISGLNVFLLLYVNFKQVYAKQEISKFFTNFKSIEEINCFFKFKLAYYSMIHISCKCPKHVDDEILRIPCKKLD